MGGPRILELMDSGVKPVIGVVHLPPLPGSPGWGGGGVEELLERVESDTRALLEGGVDAVIVENYGDAPYAVRVREPETIAAFALAAWRAARVASRYGAPIGLSLLRNSAPEAVGVAAVVGAEFVRSNAFCEPRVSPEGLLEPVAREVALKARLLGWRGAVLADVDVKHSLPLGGGYDPRVAAKETLSRCRPDALVVSGARTGEAPEPGYVAAIREAVPRARLVLGSGANPENLRLYWRLVDGFIVGTFFKRGGVTTNPVDPERVEKLMRLVSELRRGS